MIPACYNRPPITGYWAHLGYKRGKARLVWVPFRMSQACKAWSTGDRATPAPALQGWRCEGCKWLPDEARRYIQ